VKLGEARVWALGFVLCSMLTFASIGQAQPAASGGAQGQDAQATRELVREIQFMLLRLGLDPGPLDGIPRQLTNRAILRFEEIQGLPAEELQLGGRVPADLLARMRTEVARAMFGAPSKPETEPRNSPPAPASSAPGERSPATLPTPAIAPAAPKPSPDRFAPCAYDPEDFHIGANRYTPETFLKEGFDGSITRAISNLRDRLEEGRQIADKIGLSALKEVQRQARVLQYFECRLKIEQAPASKS
jgi:peptidoglycan hydrolase-like protein with peptidoglycan-binding domain